MKLFPLAVQLCATINPILLILILEEALLTTGTRQERWRKTLTFWGKALLSVGVAVVLAELGKKFEIWEGHPLFPSGHTTFAVAAATCLLLQRGSRWAFLVVPLAILMMVSLAYVGFHTWDEVAGGTVLGVTIPLALWHFTHPLSRVAS